MKKLLFTLSVISVFLAMASCGNSSTATFKLLAAPSASTTSVNVSDTETHYGSPTYLQVTMYAVWVGQTPDCTNLVKVADYGTSGQQFDIFTNPTLFEGTPPNGTYNCMVLKMLDTMNFKPANSDGSGTCVAGSTYAFDIARADDGTTWVDENFNPIVINDSPNIVYYFGTTDSAQAAAKGVSLHQIGPLTALTVPGQSTLVMDFTDRVYIQNDNGVNRCWLDSPNEMEFK